MMMRDLKEEEETMKRNDHHHLESQRREDHGPMVRSEQTTNRTGVVLSSESDGHHRHSQSTLLSQFMNLVGGCLIFNCIFVF